MSSRFWNYDTPVNDLYGLNAWGNPVAPNGINPVALDNVLQSNSLWDSSAFSNISGVGTGQANTQSSWWDKVWGGTDPTTNHRSLNKAGVLLGGLQSAAGLWLGLKQLEHAKNQLNFQKQVFKTNRDAQYNLINEARANKARAAYAANPNSMTEAEYLARWRMS